MDALALNGVVYHCRTNKGDEGWFAPHTHPDDYHEWLSTRYQRSTYMDGNNKMYFGFAQHANQLAYAISHGNRILRFHGIYAVQAEQFVRQLANAS